MRFQIAPQAPIALVRNGKEFQIFGDQSTVKAGTMWVKLVAAPPVMEVIRPTDLQASITVSR